MYLYYIFCRY